MALSERLEGCEQIISPEVYRDYSLSEADIKATSASQTGFRRRLAGSPNGRQSRMRSTIPMLTAPEPDVRGQQSGSGALALNAMPSRARHSLTSPKLVLRR